ncbi:aldolase (plasmid) [Vibrio pelagius]|uniref:3-oxo-tetronate 4-phosphate decarboxylase n=1 Tax=Vibrio pelagius TaxID=28169 RepID=A0ABY5GAB1_VIBPE|nr:aldolase [Vibrio pelagius]UTT87143.1 aldolase [Vibrio pelagius]
MFKSEAELRKEFVNLCQSLFERGYATGGAGNISLRLPNGNILTTPTGSSLGRLNMDRLSVVSMEGEHLSGDKPSKEAEFHLAIYREKPDCGAIVHLHCTALTAVSCLKDLDYTNALKACTPYYIMRIGQLPVVPYYKPGDPRIAQDLARLAANNRAFLLANHGPVVCGTDLYDAVDNAEELEETAKLALMLKGHDVRYLNEQEQQELREMKK